MSSLIYTSKLVPLQDLRSMLQYAAKGYPGAMRYPFLAQEAANRLVLAAQIVRQKTSGRMEVCVWDAYRSVETQQFIFDQYRDIVADRNPDLSPDLLTAKTCEFVRNPKTVFPHGTGGAVDVTLLANGKAVNMGTAFDEFVPKSAPDYFLRHRPRNKDDVDAATNRKILRSAMEEAGFVGIESEWWHFEFGTGTWAQTTGERVMLPNVLPPPWVESAATAERLAPSRQPCHQTGVAQVFTDPEHRAASLNHEKPAHYYVRNTHPTTDELRARLCQIFQAKHVILLPSGLSAFLSTCRGLAPRNGRIVMDERCYYECQGSVLVNSRDRNWTVEKVPLWAGEEFRKCISVGTDLVVIDNPTNWFLDSISVGRLAEACRDIGAVLAVDVSVQPVQRLMNEGEVVGILSLSKYPSAGLEIGGAIFTNNDLAFDRIKEVADLDGLVLPIASAERILEHTLWLEERMESLSRKALEVCQRRSENVARMAE